MISSRQEIDLRPKLERLDDLVLRSAGLDPAALSFEFRPLWQMDASASAAIALQKAQATQIYASLNLWPASVTAKLVEAQLAEDGTYPGAETIFAAPTRPMADFDPDQPRDPDGRWTNGGGRASQSTAPPEPSGRATMPSPSSLTYPDLFGSLAAALNPVGTAQAEEPGSEAATSAKQSAPPPSDDRSDADELILLRRVIFPVLALLAGQNLVRSAYQSVINLLSGRHTEPSASSGGSAKSAPTEPSDDHDPYKNQDVPLDRSNLEDKIKNYVLNSNNRNNNGKARFFEINLGFNTGNWDQLADQIQFNKSEAVFDSKRTDIYGNVYYNQEIRVVGANGRSVTLNGAFAIKNGVARLTTLMPD